jgi:nucleoid DNA-binding protein
MPSQMSHEKELANKEMLICWTRRRFSSKPAFRQQHSQFEINTNTTDFTMAQPNLTKREIVLEIFEKTNFPQKYIRDSVQFTLDSIIAALLQGRNVELRNFGVFELQVRKSRIGRNPNKPEKDVVIPRRAVIKFKSGKELREKLKKFDLSKISKK